MVFVLPDDCTFQVLSPQDEALVKEVVYQSIYVPKGNPRPSRGIMESADLRKYYEHWGKKGDYGLSVTPALSQKPVGAALVRYHVASKAGYGFVSEQIPELSVALLPGYRGMGLGSQLLERLISDLEAQGCPGISLSVDKRNPAMKLYEKLGFKTVRLEGNPTMLLNLNNTTLG